MPLVVVKFTVRPSSSCRNDRQERQGRKEGGRLVSKLSWIFDALDEAASFSWRSWCPLAVGMNLAGYRSQVRYGRCEVTYY